MATKSTTTTRSKKSAVGASASASARPSYKDMICEALLNLKNRNGSSRIAIRNYICSTYKGVTETMAKTQISRALREGLENGLFQQNKQSFRVATKQRPNVKKRMNKNSRTSKLTAAKKTRKIRPIKKWTMALLKDAPKHTMTHVEIFKNLVADQKIPERDAVTFGRTLKAVITRGVKDEVWTRHDDDSVTLIDVALASTSKKSNKEEKKKEKDMNSSDAEETSTESEEEDE
jgi:hypothetical protein